MYDLKLNIKENGEIVKTAEANTFDIEFGTIESLMAIMDIEEETSSFAVLKKISGAWKEVVSILRQIFPDVTEEEWKHVKLNDLVPVVLEIVKYTFSEILQIPSDSKN